MLIKGSLAKKIVQRTGLGNHPAAIRDHIRRANTDKQTRHKLLKQYDRLLQGKPIVKHELKEFLHTIGDKNVVQLPGGTYMYTIAHNPEKVLTYAKRQERVEEHKHIMEQQHERTEERERLAHEEEEEEHKKEEKAHARESITPAHGRAPKMKGGKMPIAPHIG